VLKLGLARHKGVLAPPLLGCYLEYNFLLPIQSLMFGKEYKSPSRQFSLLPSFYLTPFTIKFPPSPFQLDSTANLITMPPNFISVSEWCYHHIVSPFIVSAHFSANLRILEPSTLRLVEVMLDDHSNSNTLRWSNFSKLRTRSSQSPLPMEWLSFSPTTAERGGSCSPYGKC
jgi:hypothetical protein